MRGDAMTMFDDRHKGKDKDGERGGGIASALLLHSDGWEMCLRHRDGRRLCSG